MEGSQNLVALAAARLVDLGRADHHNRVVECRRPPLDKPLGAAGLFATDDADGVQLFHHLGLGHQQGDGAKRLTAKIEVQPGTDHAQATIGQGRRDLGDLPVVSGMSAEARVDTGRTRHVADLFAGL